jgi:hypothetical protein
MRNSNDPIENRTRGLPAGNAVAQPNVTTACHNTSVQASTLIRFVCIIRTIYLLHAYLTLEEGTAVTRFLENYPPIHRTLLRLKSARK